MNDYEQLIFSNDPEVMEAYQKMTEVEPETEWEEVLRLEREKAEIIMCLTEINKRIKVLVEKGFD